MPLLQVGKRYHPPGTKDPVAFETALEQGLLGRLADLCCPVEMEVLE